MKLTKRFTSVALILLMIMLVTFVYFTNLSHSAKKSETISPLTINEISAKLKNEIPKTVFGGLYIDSNGNIVVNVTDVSKSNIDNLIKNVSSANRNVNITYNIVDKSLAELESVCEALIPFMKEYNIASLDADDVTNKIDIELYKEDSRIENLVKKYINPEYVNISVLPSDFKFILT